MRALIATLGLLLITSAQAQTNADSTKVAPAAPKKHWYDNISVKGYAHVRYNRLLETNDSLRCPACDQSWGYNGGIFLRRARVTISGQVHPRLFLYMQTEFAQPVAPNYQNMAQVRDWYGDIGLTPDNTFRLRLGQSKVPFGFENMQSSSVRLPLDRSDAINSGAPNERDLGAFLYWAPKTYRDLFKAMVEDGLKGSGDYGLIGFGVYDGQSANRAESNNSLHVVGRAVYPLRVGDQVIEPGIQGYSGRYTVMADQRSAGVKGAKDWTYLDQRFAGSIVLYPKPFGIQAEYNVGKGPEYDVTTDSITTKDLHGGYVTATYRTRIKDHVLMPFARYQVYEGGKKNELDARSYTVNDVEFGVEWTPWKNMEVTAEYYIGDRKAMDHTLHAAFPSYANHQTGSLVRLQVQFSF